MGLLALEEHLGNLGILTGSATYLLNKRASSPWVSISAFIYSTCTFVSQAPGTGESATDENPCLHGASVPASRAVRSQQAKQTGCEAVISTKEKIVEKAGCGIPAEMSGDDLSREASLWSL